MCKSKEKSSFYRIIAGHLSAIAKLGDKTSDYAKSVCVCVGGGVKSWHIWA